MIDLAWMVAAGYLLGSISGSLVLGRLRNIDIRTLGSGNAGGTNALRSVGWRFALAVVAIDVGKGALAAGLLPMLAIAPGELLPASLLGAAAGLAAVAGHVWPVFFGFRGGKGAGTAAGVIAVAAPWCVVPLLVIWGVTILGTGFVGLATVLAAVGMVPAMWLFGPDPLPPGLGALAIALALMVVWTHRGNLARLRAGTENRFEKARLIKRRR